MDFNNVGNRLKEIQIIKDDSVENAKESAEEVPKILRPEIYDVFHVFASMLDIKSFAKLAMTSKDMYKRCMENKAIRISVDEDSYESFNHNDDTQLNFHSGIVSRSIDSYITALRKLPCNVNMKHVDISCQTNAEPLNDARRYLKEIGAQRIEDLTLYFKRHFTDSEAIISFIKDFDVVDLSIIGLSMPLNDLLLFLRSVLQLNLKKLYWDAPIPIDFILEIESPIPEMFLTDVRDISKEQLTEILSKIQSGSLRRLIIYSDGVNWQNYDNLPFDYEGPLPEDRPLVFARNDPEFNEYWFLHWHGGVTKCVRRDYDNLKMEIFKCEPWELPCALRKNEDILKDLAEKRPRVCCSAEQFNNFASSFTMLDPTHKGPLPDTRPLYCRVNEYRFWMLDEDEKLMECGWKEGSARWKSFNPDKPKVIDHPTLAKYMFWKVLKQVVKYTQYNYGCKDLNEFDRWLEDCEKLDFEYSGTLPSTRPLVFHRASYKRDKKHSRIVLLEDRLVECEFNIDRVEINICRYMKCPPILFTASTLVEMLKDPDHGNMNFKMSLDVFRDGMEQLKKSIMVLQKRLLVAEKTETEYWYRNDKVVWKVEWKDGRISISKGNDLNESPPRFLKQVFRCY